MRVSWLFATLLIAACAHTPAEVRQSHFRFEFTSERPRAQVAACAARNAEDLSPRFNTTTRPAAAENATEVVVRTSDGTAMVIEVADIPGPPTAITIWLTSNIGAKEDMQDYASHLASTVAKGC